MQKIVHRAAALTACAVWLAGPAYAAPSGPAPKSGGTITWGVATEPSCFDPHRSSQQAAFFVARNYIDSLVAKRADGSFAPWLATEWSITPDGLTYTFTLRDGVIFHDGVPLDAEAVKANFDFVKKPENAANAASLLDRYARAEVVAPNIVRLILARPDSSFLESVSNVKLGIISPKALAKGDLCGGGPALAGTGPFVFADYVRGQSARFTRNTAYAWPPGYAAHSGPAYLDGFTIRFLPEAAVRAGALSSGQLDVIEGVQPTDAPLFADQPDFTLLKGPLGAGTAFTLNVNYTRAPADDVRVRRALRDGFDPEPIVRQVYLGTVPRAWSIIGPDNPAFNRALIGGWGRDVAGANRLLDEAGWTGRDPAGFRTRDGKRLTIEVGYPQPYVRDNREVLIQGIQAAVRKNIGLDLNLRIITAGEYAKNNAAGTWAIYPNTDNPSDAARELWDMLGSKGFLYTNIPNPDPEITGLVDEALAATDLVRKRALTDRIQTLGIEKAYIVPLFAPSWFLAARKGVEGLGFEAGLDSPANGYDVWLSGE
ncbi:ABC transporter substrate-binding protein [Methylobacterium sp. NPDC080182]|uniref:ABC transporter substrate-binding protein n=1 Tax=unclassified Methylobacterium TaxID=2615210 RepID=UPI0008A750C7|nr:ABC transporter substrate-binding protein [Methylobacterium sp. 275MFSha3.1]SEI15616.1 peptide/nickel transport system substrate-binding protein [Methylobacterium sp. 275MFSha3.1]